MKKTNLYASAERKENRKRRATVALFVSPFFLNFFVFFLFPVVAGLIITLFKYNYLDPSQMEFIGLDNYKTLFTAELMKSSFWEPLWTTIKFDLVAVPLMIIIPLLLAYLINLHPPGYKIFRVIIYLPTVVSISIVGIVFGAIFEGSSTGLINGILGTEIKFMDGTWRWIVIMLASIWWQTGSNFVIFQAALRDVPKPLYEACEIDGGGRFKQFLHVTLPNIKGAIELTAFNTIIGYLSLYGQPVVLNSYLNKNSIDSPMMFIQQWLNDFSKAGLVGLVTASAVVFGLVILSVTIIEKIVLREKQGGKNVYGARYNAFIQAKTSSEQENA